LLKLDGIYITRPPHISTVLVARPDWGQIRCLPSSRSSHFWKVQAVFYLHLLPKHPSLQSSDCSRCTQPQLAIYTTINFTGNSVMGVGALSAAGWAWPARQADLSGRLGATRRCASTGGVLVKFYKQEMSDWRILSFPAGAPPGPVCSS